MVRINTIEPYINKSIQQHIGNSIKIDGTYPQLHGHSRSPKCFGVYNIVTLILP